MDRFLPAELREDLKILFGICAVALGLILLALAMSIAHAGFTQQPFTTPDGIITALAYLAYVASAVFPIAFVVHIEDIIAHISGHLHPDR